MSTQKGNEQANMSLVGHLREIRNRIALSVVALLAAFVICFAIIKPLANAMLQMGLDAGLEEYRETYLTIPKIRNRKTVFVSEDVRDELDAVVRRLGGRGMSVSGLLENLAREHLAAYRGDIEQWRKI